MSLIKVVKSKGVEFLIVTIVFGGVLYAATTAYQAKMRQGIVEKEIAKIQSAQLIIKKSLHKLLERNKLPTIDLISKADDIDLLIRPIEFSQASAAIPEDGQERLAQIAKLLEDTPNVSVIVEGGGDSETSNKDDLALGDRRAQAVKAYLIGLGIEPDRVMMVSYGEEKPIVFNKELQGSARLVFQYTERKE